MAHGYLLILRNQKMTPNNSYWYKNIVQNFVSCSYISYLQWYKYMWVNRAVKCYCSVNDFNSGVNKSSSFTFLITVSIWFSRWLSKQPSDTTPNITKPSLYRLTQRISELYLDCYVWLVAGVTGAPQWPTQSSETKPMCRASRQTPHHKAV